MAEDARATCVPARRSRTLDVLAFRDAAALTHSLETTGFAVARCYGDWQSTPVAADSRELIFVATRLS